MTDEEFSQVESATIKKALEVIGNGDYVKGRHIILRIASRLEHARKRHPRFASNSLEALEVIEAEENEFYTEIVRGDRPRAKDEALDVISTLIRFYLDEDGWNGSTKQSRLD